MQFNVLATDGGPHPAGLWALATAERILDVDTVKDPVRRVAALKLQADLIEALEGHHAQVQASERQGLADDGDDHFITDYDPAAHTEPCLADVLACAKGTPWEGDFADAAFIAQVKDLLDSHHRSIADIERQWHGDRNPDSTAAAAYKAKRHGG